MAVYVLRRDRFPFWKAADMAGFTVPLGLGFGRMGCLLAGCCYGVESGSALALSFPPRSPASEAEFKAHSLGSAAEWSHRVLPTQIFESALCLAIAAFCLLRVHGRKRYDGQVFVTFLALYAAGRFLLEYVRDDDRGGMLGLSTSQLIGVGVIALAGADPRPPARQRGERGGEAVKHGRPPPDELAPRRAVPCRQSRARRGLGLAVAPRRAYPDTMRFHWTSGAPFALTLVVAVAVAASCQPAIPDYGPPGQCDPSKGPCPMSSAAVAGGGVTTVGVGGGSGSAGVGGFGGGVTGTPADGERRHPQLAGLQHNSAPFRAWRTSSPTRSAGAVSRFRPPPTRGGRRGRHVQLHGACPTARRGSSCRPPTRHRAGPPSPRRAPAPRSSSCRSSTRSTLQNIASPLPSLSGHRHLHRSRRRSSS